MGRRDSSRTRVRPVFDQLLARDPTGRTWLPTLLALPEPPDGTPALGVTSLLPITAAAWGKPEQSLSPPRSLLRWLVQHAVLPLDGAANDRGTTREKREALIRRDPTVIAEALALLGQPALPPRDWYILEGPSKPDVYLATPDLRVVIEGKRTEAGPTRDTTWMPTRHQMLRHLDAAWEEVRGAQKLAGFFIVAGEGGAADLAVPQKWQKAARATILPGALAGSLPHRTPEERQAIAAAFLGVTTWQRVCATLDLDYAALPDT